MIARLYVPLYPCPPGRIVGPLVQVRHGAWRVTNAVRRNLARGGSTAIVGGARGVGWTRGGRCPVATLSRSAGATTIGGREVCSPCHPGWFRPEVDGDCCTMLLDLV